MPFSQIRYFDYSQAPLFTSHRIIADSGASAHFTPRRDFVRNIRPLDPPLAVEGALGEMVYASEQGEGEITIGTHVLRVSKIILCHQLRDTLLSVVGLLNAGHHVKLGANSGEFVEREQSFQVPLSYEGNIFTFNINPSDGRSIPPGKTFADICAVTRAQNREV